RFGREGRHRRVGNSARHDAVVPREVTVAIEREAMHCDALGDAHADSGNFSILAAPGHPHAPAAFNPVGRHAKLAADPDQRLLDAVHVGNYVNRLAECDDRIADKLTRAMPGDVAAPIDVDDGRAWVTDRPVEWCGSLAGRIDRL